jgi:hypothetical protein
MNKKAKDIKWKLLATGGAFPAIHRSASSPDLTPLTFVWIK